MPYCTKTDITAYTGVTYSSSELAPAVSSIDVENFIDQVSDEIDLALSAIGIATVSSSEALHGILKKYNAVGATCQVLQRTAANPDEFRRQEAMCEKYNSWYSMLIGDKVYQSIVLNGAGVPAKSYAFNQVTDGTFDEIDISYIDEGFKP